MTNPTQIERIAASLTEAQRRLVMASGPDDITGEEGLGVEIKGAEYRVARKLFALGMGNYSHGSPYSDMYYNFPLGLALRSYLTEKQDG